MSSFTSICKMPLQRSSPILLSSFYRTSNKLNCQCLELLLYINCTCFSTNLHTFHSWTSTTTLGSNTTTPSILSTTFPTSPTIAFSTLTVMFFNFSMLKPFFLYDKRGRNGILIVMKSAFYIYKSNLDMHTHTYSLLHVTFRCYIYTRTHTHTHTHTHMSFSCHAWTQGEFNCITFSLITLFF